jgi:hypothetical protein
MSLQILQIVYGSDIATIRNEILSYLKLKAIVLFLFDNLDRMRAPGSFDDMDSLLILGLVESLQQITKHDGKQTWASIWPLISTPTIRGRDVLDFMVEARLTLNDLPTNK